MPSSTWLVETKKKEIYLTFDDGPIPEITEWVLEVLKTNNIQATFFCVGENIKKHPGIFERLIRDGHAVGNHTFNHIKGWKNSDSTYFENIDLWEKTASDTGIPILNKKLFRPPYGQITFSQAKHLKDKYEIVMWDIITGDFDKTLNKENCLKKCIDMSRPGSIIVFHDNIKAWDNLQYILPEYIQAMLAKGYIFTKW